MGKRPAFHTDRALDRNCDHRDFGGQCLLPALNKAREKGRAVFCINNQKQLGLGFIGYATDNKEYFPNYYQCKKRDRRKSKVLDQLSDTGRLCYHRRLRMSYSGRRICRQKSFPVIVALLPYTVDAMETPKNTLLHKPILRTMENRLCLQLSICRKFYGASTKDDNLQAQTGVTDIACMKLTQFKYPSRVTITADVKKAASTPEGC